MKTILLSVFSLLMMVTAKTQDKWPPVDKSPMDLSYCPPNFPVLKLQQKATEPLMARVIYSRPAVLGRKIFGELLEYGKVWRVGANEATEVEFFKEVYINNTKIKKGRYTLYAIPSKDKWTIILNKETDTWGAFGYKPAFDVVRMDVAVETLSTPAEVLSIYFDMKDAGKYMMNIVWDTVAVAIPFSTMKQ